MFLKIRTKSGWLLKEADEVQYSAFAYGASSNNFYRTLTDFYPNLIHEIFTERGIEDIEVYNFPTTISLSETTEEPDENTTYHYAILDKTKGVVFSSFAYIINDNGKTVAKIGN